MINLFTCCSACRASADFLPIALVLGLATGKTTEVPIVIVAEDGVTSLRYYLNIFRAEASKNSSGSNSTSSWSLGTSANSGGADGPSASLNLRSEGNGDNEQESMLPSMLSARTARQPGAAFCSSAPCTQAFLNIRTISMASGHVHCAKAVFPPGRTMLRAHEAGRQPGGGTGCEHRLPQKIAAKVF